jgi:putative intracellular protease/amidase
LQIAPAKKSKVVQDRELITGQNPFSDKELAAAFLKALKFNGEVK